MGTETTDTAPGELDYGAAQAADPLWRAAAWRTMEALAGTHPGPARHPKAREQEGCRPPPDHPFKRYEI